MLLTDGMIIPTRARGAGKMLSTCRRSTVVTEAMVFPSAVTGDWRAVRAAANTEPRYCAPGQGKASAGPSVFGIKSLPNRREAWIREAEMNGNEIDMRMFAQRAGANVTFSAG